MVDDNEDSAELLREMLQWVGHEVAVAHDGPSALAVAEQFVPEVALLDIGLPVMDGYELGRRLHAMPQGARCRLVALSGYGQDRDRARSRASGFETHLVKPIDGWALQVVASDPSGAVVAPIAAAGRSRPDSRLQRRRLARGPSPRTTPRLQGRTDAGASTW